MKAAKKNPGQEMLEKEVMMIFKDKRCLKYCVVKKLAKQDERLNENIEEKNITLPSCLARPSL